MKADPKDVSVRSVLGPLYLATGRASDAKKVYDDLLAQKPNDITGLLGLADVAIVQKEWSEAVDEINRARSVAPTDPAPGIKLAEPLRPAPGLEEGRGYCSRVSR